jgi:moderate conductance mechanosensitive channel
MLKPMNPSLFASSPSLILVADPTPWLRKFYHWFSGAPLHIITILIIAYLISLIGTHAIKSWMRKLAAKSTRQSERAVTIGSILKSFMNAVIGLVALAMVLGELGLNLGPIITSAGVLGVGLSLGSQTLIRDFLAGIFMLVEDQYGVGDKIITLDVEGTVESVGLRVTTVRASDGTLWYLRNGEITKLGNKNRS